MPTTTTTAAVTVMPSTSGVYLDGHKVGHINHPIPGGSGRYIGYFHAERVDDTRAEVFDSLEDAVAFVVAAAIVGGGDEDAPHLPEGRPEVTHHTRDRERYAYARAFKTIVREAGFSDADLAELLGISRVAVSRRLNGHASIKVHELLMVMARADDFDEVNMRYWDLAQGFAEHGAAATPADNGD